MSKEEKITFTALGRDVCYELNGIGTHEQPWFDGELLGIRDLYKQLNEGVAP